MSVELRFLASYQLKKSPYQPRRHFSAESLEELAASILHAGLLHPILVRSSKKVKDEFEIIAGERRWRAAQLAGLERIPCLIKELNDEQVAAAATIENINRVDLNPLEEAQAYQRLVDEFHYTHDEIGATVGKSRARITNMLRLLRLDPRVQTLLVEKKLTEGHGKTLAGLPQGSQWNIAQKAYLNHWSVRKLEKTVKNFAKSVKQESITKDTDLSALINALEAHLGTPVNLKYNTISGKGELTLSFQNLAILDGIFEKMNFDYNKT